MEPLDNIIMEPLAGILQLTQPKPDKVATSHSRCIHLTNVSYRELLKKREVEKQQKEVDDRRKEIEKQARKEEKKSNEDKKVAARADIEALRNRNSSNIEGEDAVPVKKARLTNVSCSNFKCNQTCYKNDCTYNTWTACPKTKCKLIFCQAVECIEAVNAHSLICKLK